MWEAVQIAWHDHPIGYGLWIGGALLALAAGSSPARLAGLAILANVAVSVFWNPDEVRTVFWHLLIEDTAMLIVLALLLQRYACRWLLWATAVQTLAVVSHLPRLFDPAIRPLGYAWFEAALGYLMVGVVVFGAFSRKPREQH